MVDTQAANMVEEYAQRLSYQGLSMDQYFQFTGMNAQTLKEQLKASGTEEHPEPSGS